MGGNHKASARNRNKEYVHQTVESYLEWFEKAYYPETKPKRGRPSRNKKTTDPKDYCFKIVHKEIILNFD